MYWGYQYFRKQGGKLIVWINRQPELPVLALKAQKDGARWRHGEGGILDEKGLYQEW